MLKAALLDRDGVINEEVDLVDRPDQLKLIPGSADAIAQLNHYGVYAIILTNQPVVARNLCSEPDLRCIHEHLEQLLLDAAGARVDRIYYCPHHPGVTLPNANPLYRKVCGCRKPGTGMIEDAMRDFGIKADECVMIGDSTRDILAGRRMHIPTVMVGTGHGGRDAQYDVRANWTFLNLFFAIQYLCSEAIEA